MPHTWQVERYCQTQTSTAHLIFSVSAGEETALSGMSEWLVAASSFSSVHIGSLYKMSAREQTTKTLFTAVPVMKEWQAFLLFAILCWHFKSPGCQCGGVASYAEYQKMHILWRFLSVEGFGSDSAPFEASWEASDKFCHGGVGDFWHVRFLIGTLWNN